jgi:hypothetical protein
MYTLPLMIRFLLSITDTYTILKDRNMNRAIEETGKADACTAGITNIIIGIIAYLFLVVPILALTITSVMNPGTSQGIAIVLALVMTGLDVI